MKKCVLINCFASSNEMRVEPIREVLEERGYQTFYISSDFHHTLKKHVELEKSIIPIHVRAYKKNISIARLQSHKEFSDKAFELLVEYRPDLIYIKFPPNSLVKAAFEYKKNHECKIILDLFDLWPESLPAPGIVKKIGYPILKKWADYRDKYISCADLLLLECDMYKQKIKGRLPENTYTLYLTKRDINYVFYPCEDGKIRLCFIGGINNLINIGLICKVIKEFLRNGVEVSLDVIGDGVKRNKFLRKVKETGCMVVYHGIIYDEDEKNRIMSRCDFGINLINSNVQIALSIKSIEYFRAGLAVLNNVKNDTWDIIEKTKSGINISEHLNFGESNINLMKENARKTYIDYFSIECFKSRFSDAYEKCIE